MGDLGYADLRAIEASVRELIRPPRRISVADAAMEAMTVKSASGIATAWDPVRTPYMVEPMNLLKSRRHDAVVFAGPARSGKTLALIDGWLVHSLTADPGDIGVYFSTQPLAHDWRKRRLGWLHREADAVRDKLSRRAHDTNIEMVEYRHGMILNLGWPSSSQLAQRDLRYVALSDYDSFPDDIGGEGSAFDLARKRIQVAGSAGMCLVESSPKRTIITAEWIPDGPHQAPPVDGGILPLFNRGDRRRWYWPCLDGCGEWWMAPACPAYEPHHDIAEAALTAHVACPHCGQVYKSARKDALNSRGRWVPEGCTLDRHGHLSGRPRESSTASFWLLGCAAAYQSWHSLVKNELQALRELDTHGDERALKTTRNVDQGIPHLPSAIARARAPEFLDARREHWERFYVPPGVRTLIAAVDNQADRWEVRVWGYGRDRERWLVDAFSIREWEKQKVLPASYAEHWDALTQRVVNATYRIDESRELRIHRVAVDLRGYAEDKESQTSARAYEWWRRLKALGLGHRVRLVQGRERSAKLVRETYPDSRKRSDRQARSAGDVPVLEIHTTALKDTAWADLLREAPGAGYVHLPMWLHEDIVRELLAEHRTPRRWEKLPGRANETWDCLVYADALWHHLGGAAVKWATPPPWASDDWTVNPEVVTREQRHEIQERAKQLGRSLDAQRRPRQNWVNRWR